MLKQFSLAIAFSLYFCHYSFCQLKLAINYKTYTTLNSSAAATISMNALKIREPHTISSFYLNPRFDSLWIMVSIYVADSILEPDQELALYRRCEQYINILSKAKLPTYKFCTVKLCYYDRKMGSLGTSIQYLFSLHNKKLYFSEIISRKYPNSSDPSFWKRLKDYRLPQKDILSFESDTSVSILHFAKDSTGFPKDISDNEVKETIRLIYEVIGNDIKKYSVILESYFDPLLNNKTTSASLIKETPLHANPNFFLHWYRELFPKGIPYCGKCE